LSFLLAERGEATAQTSLDLKKENKVHFKQGRQMGEISPNPVTLHPALRH
jgi:hypothetical protein